MSKRKIDWLNHGLEFFVVIIGILIAFQLNKCSENRKDSKNVSAHVSQIEEETKLNSFFMKNGVKYAAIELNKLDTLIELLEGQENYEKIDELITELSNFSGIYIRKNAYASLMESGDFRLIKSLDDKQKIINLYEFYEWVESFNDDAFTKYNTEFYPYIQENFDRMTSTFQDEKLYGDKKLRNILYSYRAIIKLKVEKLGQCADEMEKFLSGEEATAF